MEREQGLVPAHFADDLAGPGDQGGTQGGGWAPPPPPHPPRGCEEPAPRPPNPETLSRRPTPLRSPASPTAPPEGCTPRPLGPGSAALCWTTSAGPPQARAACPAARGLPSPWEPRHVGRPCTGLAAGMRVEVCTGLRRKVLAVHQRRAGEADLRVPLGRQQEGLCSASTACKVLSAWAGGGTGRQRRATWTQLLWELAHHERDSPENPPRGMGVCSIGGSGSAGGCGANRRMGAASWGSCRQWKGTSSRRN